MRILILLLLLLFQISVFAADFQTHLSVSAGPNMTFSKAEHNIWKQYNGFRVSNIKINLNTLLSIGYNHKINNNILTSISILAETGYNFSGYMRPEDGDFGIEGGTVYFHSLVLGLNPTLNFYNDLSFGIGAGVMFPLSADIDGYWDFMGYYKGVEKLSFNDIKKLYKFPVMPYVKVSVERYFNLSDIYIDMIVGGIISYNFGMSCEKDILSQTRYGLSSFSYESYKFSAITLEVFIAVGFGRPK